MHAFIALTVAECRKYRAMMVDINHIKSFTLARQQAEREREREREREKENSKLTKHAHLVVEACGGG